MKDLPAEFRSEVTIHLGRITEIILVDVGLEPLGQCITSFRQRFPPPTMSHPDVQQPVCVL
jgi:hypothetical protein